MAKSKKPCEKNKRACYWQFADWCLYYPRVKIGYEDRRIPDFRQRDGVSQEECEKIQILKDQGSWHNPQSFVAKKKTELESLTLL